MSDNLAMNLAMNSAIIGHRDRAAVPEDGALHSLHRGLLLAVGKLPGGQELVQLELAPHQDVGVVDGSAWWRGLLAVRPWFRLCHRLFGRRIAE